MKLASIAEVQLIFCKNTLFPSHCQLSFLILTQDCANQRQNRKQPLCKAVYTAQIIATLLRRHSSQPFRAQAPLADQNSGRAIASPATSFPFLEKGKAWMGIKAPLFARGGQGCRKTLFNGKEGRGDFRKCHYVNLCL